MKLFLMIVLLFSSMVGADPAMPDERPSSFGNVDRAFRIARYESFTSLSRFSEDLVVLRMKERNLNTKYVIRICSTLPFEEAIFSAALSPFEIADYMESIYGVDAANLTLDKSGACSSAQTEQTSPVEIWFVGDDQTFQIEDDAYSLTAIEFKSIGFDPIQCKKPSFEKSLKQALTAMKTSQNAFLGVVGIYMNRPSKQLARNLETVRLRLRRAQINDDRFVIRKDIWHFGDSACGGTEPNVPSLFLINLVR